MRVMERSVGGVRAAKFVGIVLLILVASGSLAPFSDDRAEAQTTPNGNDATFLWAEQFGTGAADGARSVAVDPSDGSALAAGYTNGALDRLGLPIS